MTNLTRAQAREAETFCTDHRLSLLRFLQMDLSKVAPSAVDGCKRAKAAAESDPMKFDAMLTHHAVAALFACGALFFGRR